MSTNMPNLKQIGGGHRKTLVDLTWNDPITELTGIGVELPSSELNCLRDFVPESELNWN